jgi:hypothetical protein
LIVQGRLYTLATIASNGDRFTDFAPYVPSINDEGIVAFQATLRDGRSGVFTSDGASVTDIAVTSSARCPAQRFTSHPDINRSGALAVYATLRTGEDALLIRTGGSPAAVGRQEGFTAISPLGPTLNEAGDVAFRAVLADGRACACLRRSTGVIDFVDTGQGYRGFEGLPVVDAQGRLFFRADLHDGRQGILMHHEGHTRAIATTGEELAEIARFFSVDDHGTVAFAGRRRSGLPGIFAATAGRLDGLLDAQAGFESFRGVLLDNAGPVVFYGTPVGGSLGIHTGPDPLRHRLLGLGDTFLGAAVVDFALNPVSVNERGQLAIRVALDDARQFVLRADPEG